MKLINYIVAITLASVTAVSASGATPSSVNKLPDADFPTGGSSKWGLVQYDDGYTLTPNGDGSITMQSDGGDLIYYYYLGALDSSYKFYARYTSKRKDASIDYLQGNSPFAGFWKDIDKVPKHENGAYADLTGSENGVYTDIKFTAQPTSTTAILSVVGTNTTVTYKDVWVIQEPTITVTGLLTDGDLDYAKIGSEVSVTPSEEGFPVYYQIDDNAPVEITGGKFTVPAGVEVKVFAYFEEYDERFDAKTYSLRYSDDSGNLMARNITGTTLGEVPTGWSSTNVVGDSITWPNGANVRNAKGRTSSSDGSSEIFFIRWDSGGIESDFNKVYSYKVHLTGGKVYHFQGVLGVWANYNIKTGKDYWYTDNQTPGVKVLFNDHLGIKSGNISSVMVPFENVDTSIGEGVSLYAATKQVANLYYTVHEDGDYYLSFVGSRGIFPLRDATIEAAYDIDYSSLYTEVKAEAEALIAQYKENSVVANGKEYTSLRGALATSTDATDEAVAYKAAYLAIKAAIPVLEASIASYEAYSTAASVVPSTWKGDYKDASSEKISTLDSLVNLGDEYDVTKAEKATADDKILLAYRAVVESNAIAEKYASESYYKNQTESIASAKIGEDGSFSGWTTSSNGYDTVGKVIASSGSPAKLSTGLDLGKYYYDTDNYWTESYGEDFNQTLSSLPAGKYRLSVFERASGDFKSFQLYGGNSAVDMFQIGGDENKGVFYHGWNIAYVDFDNYATSDVKIGVKIASELKQQWFSFDNFQLVRIGDLESTLTVTVQDRDRNAINGAKVSLGGSENSATTEDGVATLTVKDAADFASVTISCDGWEEQTVNLSFDGTSSEVSTTVTLLKAGNLLKDALSGAVGAKPTGWSAYTREGAAGTYDSNAVLRNSDGGSSGGDVAFWLVRWDYTPDAYYTYKVTIPESGVYDFSMKFVEWGDRYSVDNNQKSQVPGIRGLRVTFDKGTGYDYNKSQSFIYNATVYKSHENKANINWEKATAKFYAEAGEYYLSLTGAYSMYVVKDFELVRDAEASDAMTAQPAAEDLDFSQNVVLTENGKQAYIGTQIVNEPAETDMEYVFVPASSVAFKTYSSIEEALNLQESGTLYAYNVVDGVHGEAKKYDITYEEATGGNLKDAVYSMVQDDDSNFFEYKKGTFTLFNDVLYVSTHYLAAEVTLTYNLPEDTKMYYSWEEDKSSYQDPGDYKDGTVEDWNKDHQATDENGSANSSGEGTENGSASDNDQNALTPSTSSRRLKDADAETESTDDSHVIDRGAEVEYSAVPDGFTEYTDSLVYGSEGTLKYVIVKDDVVSNQCYLTIQGVATSVNEIATDEANAEAVYYNLNGIRVSAEHLTPGFYIKKQGSKTSKICVGTL